MPKLHLLYLLLLLLLQLSLSVCLFVFVWYCKRDDLEPLILTKWLCIANINCMCVCVRVCVLVCWWRCYPVTFGILLIAQFICALRHSKAITTIFIVFVFLFFYALLLLLLFLFVCLFFSRSLLSFRFRFLPSLWHIHSSILRPLWVTVQVQSVDHLFCFALTFGFDVPTTTITTEILDSYSYTQWLRPQGFEKS